MAMDHNREENEGYALPGRIVQGRDCANILVKKQRLAF